MPKSTKQTKTRSTPYNKSNQTQTKSHVKLNKKPITKSEKLRNADLTDKLDILIEDLSSELKTKKKNKKDKATIENEKIKKQKEIELEQQQYEKTQNDLDDALGLLTRL